MRKKALRTAALALSIAGASPASAADREVESTSGPSTDAPEGTTRAGVPHVTDTLAEGGDGNGVYGRFDGNFSASLGLGARYLTAGDEMFPSAKLSIRYYQALGMYVSFSQAVSQTPAISRLVELGVTLEPLFLLRFNSDAEWGRAFWDLTLDSLSLSLGAHLSEPTGATFGSQSGFCFGLGAGVPLLARAPGPWARLRGTVQTGSPDLTGTVELLLEWQWMQSVLQPEP